MVRWGTRRFLRFGRVLIAALVLVLSVPAVSGMSSAAQAQSAPAAAQAQMPAHRPPLMVGSLPHDLSIMGMFVQAGAVVKAVIIALLLASILTWTVWIAKNVELNTAKRSLKKAITALSTATSLGDVAKTGSRVVDAMLQEARAELKQSEGLKGSSVNDRIEARLERVQAAATRQAQAGTNLLATIGATSPFVGLFGTVWGIMYSFIGISQAQTTNLMVVAPGIAEALLATAFGLIAAVPAVVIYNFFARALTGYRGLVCDAATLILCIAGRDLDRRVG